MVFVVVSISLVSISCCGDRFRCGMIFYCVSRVVFVFIISMMLVGFSVSVGVRWRWLIIRKLIVWFVIVCVCFIISLVIIYVWICGLV